MPSSSSVVRLVPVRGLLRAATLALAASASFAAAALAQDSTTSPRPSTPAALPAALPASLPASTPTVPGMDTATRKPALGAADSAARRATAIDSTASRSVAATAAVGPTGGTPAPATPAAPALPAAAAVFPPAGRDSAASRGAGGQDASGAKPAVSLDATAVSTEAHAVKHDSVTQAGAPDAAAVAATPVVATPVAATPVAATPVAAPAVAATPVAAPAVAATPVAATPVASTLAPTAVVPAPAPTTSAGASAKTGIAAPPIAAPTPVGAAAKPQFLDSTATALPAIRLDSIVVPHLDSANTELANAYVQRADSLYQARKVDAAVAEYRRGLVHDPTDIDTWYGLAELYHSEGRTKQAVDTYTLALSTIEHAPELRVPFATLLLESKRKAEAMKVLQKGIEVDADASAEMKTMLGKIVLGELDETNAGAETPTDAGEAKVADGSKPGVSAAPSTAKAKAKVAPKKRKKLCKLFCPGTIQPVGSSHD
jgi:hypothetical protein